MTNDLDLSPVVVCFPLIYLFLPQFCLHFASILPSVGPAQFRPQRTAADAANFYSASLRGFAFSCAVVGVTSRTA